MRIPSCLASGSRVVLEDFNRHVDCPSEPGKPRTGRLASFQFPCVQAPRPIRRIWVERTSRVCGRGVTRAMRFPSFTASCACWRCPSADSKNAVRVAIEANSRPYWPLQPHDLEPGAGQYEAGHINYDIEHEATDVCGRAPAVFVPPVLAAVRLARPPNCAHQEMTRVRAIRKTKRKARPGLNESTLTKTKSQSASEAKARPIAIVAATGIRRKRVRKMRAMCHAYGNHLAPWGRCRSDIHAVSHKSYKAMPAIGMATTSTSPFHCADSSGTAPAATPVANEKKRPPIATTAPSPHCRLAKRTLAPAPKKSQSNTNTCFQCEPRCRVPTPPSFELAREQL